MDNVYTSQIWGAFQNNYELFNLRVFNIKTLQDVGFIHRWKFKGTLI